MPAPSGFENFRNVFVVVRSLPGDRLSIVNIFELGQLALDDAARRFIDTGDEYTIFNASGLTKSDVLNVINNNIVGIASGIAPELFFTLPLQGDFKGTNTFALHNIISEEMDKDQFIMWNLSSPSAGVDSLTFRTSYTVEASETGDIDFDVNVTEMPSGVDLSNPIITNTSFNLLKPPGGWVQDRLYIDEFPITLSVPVTNFNIKLTRTTQTFPKKVRIINLAVRYGQ